MAYSLAVYAGFLCICVYAIGFIQRVGVPKDIDDGASASTAAAIAIDLALLALLLWQLRRSPPPSGTSNPALPGLLCTLSRGSAG